VTVLSGTGLTRLYGDPCGDCESLTGDDAGRNRCSACGTIVACADVSLDIERGEVLGVVGESGSGKSSLAELLALERGEGHSRGSVRFDGYEGNLLESDYDTRTRLRNDDLALVHQHIRDGLTLSFSGGGNVAEKPLAAGERSFEAVRERVRSLFEQLEVPVDRMDDPAETYSGGMQRRVQLARALVTDPAVVVLDEPTTGLDVSVQARVLDTFRRVQRERGVAAVVVSHDLGVVRLLADRTLVMRHGRVVERGLTDRILEDPHHAYTQQLINSTL
jgi:putative phosphonate transport system ATP-binding protein